MDPELKNNLAKRKTWMRGLYMLIFVVLYSVAEVVVGAVVVLQFLFTLFTGQTNARLILFGHDLSRYIYEVMLFMTFNSEELPFPFREWPARNSADSPSQQDKPDQPSR
jgi:Domain of unknown function (DUF4389)